MTNYFIDLAEELTTTDEFLKASKAVDKAMELGFTAKEISDTLNGLYITSLYPVSDGDGLLAPDHEVLKDNPDITLGDLMQDMDVIGKIIVQLMCDRQMNNICEFGSYAVRNSDYDIDPEEVDYSRLWDIFYDCAGADIKDHELVYETFGKWVSDNMETVCGVTVAAA